MRYKRIATIMVIGILLAWSAPNASGQLPGDLILQVPDWNQPVNYGVANYLNWCSPVAGGNLMGYWEDVMGCTGLTDRQVEPAGPGYANNLLTYQQGLFNDGQIEMGYYMGTQGWAPPPNTQFPPNTVFGTALVNIGPGMISYATAAWVDPGATAITKVAYPNILVGKDTKPPTVAMWNNYIAEINANRPVLCSFDKWVGAFTGTNTIQGFPAQTIEYYSWNLDTEAHTVVGVGYIDITPGFQNNGLDEWFVCQDGWPGPGLGAGGTGQYVAVPVDTMWQQNDYVYDVPEPFTLTMLLVGSVGLILRRKRRI